MDESAGTTKLETKVSSETTSTTSGFLAPSDPMAEGQRKKNLDGRGLREVRPGVWEINVYIGRDPVTGKVRQHWERFHGGERAAIERRDKLRVELRSRPLTTDGTFGHLIEEWWKLTEPRRKRSTNREYRRLLDQRLLPRFANKPLKKLKVRDFDLYFGELEAEGLAPASINQIKAIARTALNQAIKWGWITSNPAGAASSPTVRNKKVVPMTLDDLKKIAAVIRTSDPHLAIFFWLMTALGARRGEVIGLRWRNVDLKRRTVHINTAILDAGGEVYEDTPKTHQHRDVDIDVNTAQLLKALRAELEERARLAMGPDATLAPDAFVFSLAADCSTPLKPDYVTKKFTYAAIKAGVRGEKLDGVKGVSPHDLRHLSASLQLAAGQDVTTVSKRLGHNNVSTTLNIYAHVMPGKGQEAADLLGQLLHGEPPKKTKKGKSKASKRKAVAGPAKYGKLKSAPVRVVDSHTATTPQVLPAIEEET